MENMTKEQDDELKQDIEAFTLVKALDLLDDCHHYLKANPPSKETMNYSKWENLVEETDYMREYNANAAYERANSASGSVAAPKPDTKSECPKCGSYNIIMFTSDDDLCQNCEHTFPGVLGSRLKTAPPKEEDYNEQIITNSFDYIHIITSLRQQLKEREEALKEFAQILLDYKHSGVEVNIDYLLDKFPYENIEGKI